MPAMWSRVSLHRSVLTGDLLLTALQTLPRPRHVLRGGADRCLALVHPETVIDPICKSQTRRRRGGQRVCGKPRSTFEVAGSGQRDVTTFVRV